jgi:inositol-polyphosphate multikinase
VLENLSFPFSKPNILDVKLGTELYDASASPEKRERMIATARATTSYETGVRLTGFQVYDNSTGQPVVTPKSYGKTIKPADLSDGITRFFPVPTAEQTQGLPPQLLLPILRGTRKNVAEIRAAIARVEMRMVGGSILVIYEGDHTRAKEALEKFDEAKVGEVDEDEDDEEEESAKVGPPYLVKLIDFAHTSIAEGQGPDVGVLKGLDTVLELLDERIEAVSTL